MSCNNPMLFDRSDILPSGKYKYIPIGKYRPELKRDYPNSILVPCGKCDGCKADYTRSWADRMILELDHSRSGIFITLTYDNDHLPLVVDGSSGESFPTLNKRDIQLFFKRLRKHFLFRGREIRYYLCGEYGPTTGRPHYHAILFGLSIDDFPDLKCHGVNPLNQPYYVSDLLANEIWKNGFCLISSVSYQTCAYVARYVRKKQFGSDVESFSNRLKEPVFSLMSRSPGIGMYYVIDHPECFDKSKFYFADQSGVVSVNLPSAFLRKLELLDPEKFLQLKKERMSAAESTFFAKLSQTDVYFDELCERQEGIISDSGLFLDKLQVL